MANHPPDQPNTEGTPADKPAPDHVTGTAPEEIAKTSHLQPSANSAAGAALQAAISGLPAVPGTDGLRANANYYATAPREELLSVLRGLKFPGNEAAEKTRDDLVRRVEGGEFGSTK
jgi:hypothetical protein